ncbi:MAG: rod shape-determining protein MreD [Gemmobacter sp.]
MADPVRDPRWGWRLGYVGVFAILMWLRLLPIGAPSEGWPAPDVMVALTAAWVLRRPDHLPAVMIALVILIEDMMLMRPPGLWAAAVVLMAEFLRARAALSRELPFPAEWFLVAVTVAGTAALHRVVLGITLTPAPPVTMVMVQVAGTVALYPVVVAALHLGLGLRKPAAGEVDGMGRRL